MNSYGNGHLSDETERPDIRTLLAASMADDEEPMNAMLAKAMLYSQDADRKLEQARAAREQAEKYRAEIQKNTIEETEVYCAELRVGAERERAEAVKTREEAHTAWEAARAELERAGHQRTDAEAYADKIRADLDDERTAILTEAVRQAAVMRNEAQAEADAVVAERQERADEEIRKALAAIGKVQSAANAELEAQAMYTEALRFKAASPKWEGAARTAAKKPARGRTVRKTAKR